MGKLDFRDPNVQIAGLVCFLAVAVLYGFFLTTLMPFGYKARSEQIAKLETEYEKISADLMKAKQSASRLPQVQAEFDQIKKRWEESSTLLPTEKEMAELLTQITVSGQRAGVDFLLFEPKAPTPHDIYVEHPVAVEVQGGYHDIGMFLSRMSNLPRIVNVNSIQMKNMSNPADPKGPQIVDADMSISAYRLLTDTERAGQAPAPAAVPGKAAPARPQAAQASAAQAAGGNVRAH